MNKIQILTGWGYVGYATAAAVALRKFSSADVLGISQRKLPIHLANLSNQKKCPYNKIIILGIGLNKNSKLMINALKSLKKNSVEVVYISALTIPKKFKKHFASCVEDTENSLIKIVADFFHAPYKDLLPIDSSSEKDLKGKYLEQFLLIKAAQHRYRCFQDETAFSNAVKTLSITCPESKAARGKNVDNKTVTAGDNKTATVAINKATTVAINKATTVANQQKMMIEFYKKFGNRELKGKSQIMMDLYQTINKIGPKDYARVMIFGETGTGKETVAVHLHEKSPRREKPMITFNCASSNKNLLESHLFGHVKGAFTGATIDKKGAFEEADGGTLFLDEIGELPLDTQANILRVLQESRFNKIGSVKEISVNVRIIAATNRDLPKMIQEGKFREDLFYRLNVVPIHIPPLRDHIEDITEIADNIWFNKGLGHLNPKKIEILKTYNWPGNVRELSNFLERAAVLEENDFEKLLNIHKKEIASMKSETEHNLPENLNELIRYQANKLYLKYGENKAKTAKAMGITRVTLRKHLE